MFDPRSAYFQYVRDVLGAGTVLRARDTENPKTELDQRAFTQTGHWPAPGEVDLLVLHRGTESFFEGVAGELWEKMRGAMSLGSARLLEVETRHEDLDGVLLDLLSSYPAKVSLLLSETPNRSSDLRVIGPSKVL
ncbi:MAG TPA: hypothetical protein PL182_09425, partial [Pseudobdellovibrionaceae bacterium]|nr:hypothetical protein [Pseudobdellovibrionaceae bacterium]